MCHRVVSATCGIIPKTSIYYHYVPLWYSVNGDWHTPWRRQRPRILKHSRNGFTISVLQSWQLLPDEMLTTPIHTCTKCTRVNRRCCYFVRVFKSFSSCLCQKSILSPADIRPGHFAVDTLAELCRSLNRTVEPVSSHVTNVHGPHTTANVSLLNSAPCNGIVITVSTLENVATCCHGE